LIEIPCLASRTNYVRIVEGNSRPNTMVKTILCTIDLSASSKHAIQWAVTLAQQLKAHLTILYTYRLMPAPSGEVVEVKKRMEEDALLQFKQLEKEYLNGKGVSYDFRTEVGFIADRIEDHAKKNNLNVVVMGKNVGSNNSETFTELMENIHVPTLVVP
jgi:nucleotide-binding universal stress UspA family protein